jgi:uncharacterized protein
VSNSHSSSSGAIEIVHEPTQQRFVAVLDGMESVVDYQLSENTIDFNHTYVPVALRGTGIAEKLVRQALAWAVTQGYQIRASCWYVQKFLR